MFQITPSDELKYSVDEVKQLSILWGVRAHNEAHGVSENRVLKISESEIMAATSVILRHYYTLLLTKLG